MRGMPGVADKEPAGAPNPRNAQPINVLFPPGGSPWHLLTKGWCPPLPLLRRLGVRTRDEIAREKYALQSVLEDR